MKKISILISLLLIVGKLFAQDNIVDVGCFTVAPKTEWGIDSSWVSKVKANVARPWLVGDLDGDELPEIVAISIKNRLNTEIYRTLLVFPGSKTNEGRDKHVEIQTAPFSSYRSISSTGLIAVKKGTVTKRLIVVTGSDGFLYAYSYEKAKIDPTDAEEWVSSKKVMEPNGVVNAANKYPLDKGAPIVMFTNYPTLGSGTQVYSGGKLFDAFDGVFLAELPTGSNRGFSAQNDAALGAELPGTVNVNLGAGMEQLIVVGNEAYGYNGTNFVKKKSVAAPTGFSKDGHISVADFNDDESTDALVSVISGADPKTAKVQLYGWDIKNQKILFTYEIPVSGSKSVPFIGDIDGDGRVEILLLNQDHVQGGPGYLRAFKLPTTFGPTAKLIEKWNKPISENWGRTGITLFDFNLDGAVEIVYRDEQKLFILDSLGNVKDEFPSTSATTWEYPIVVDIDNDGAAEIVCIGGEESQSRPGEGYVVVYKSKKNRWAPARSVWNQYSYNSVNVNKDLTIGSKDINPAKKYKGKDNKKIAPFNGFLQQQTLLNKDGYPYSPSPSADIHVNTNTEYDATNDKLKITVFITNKGESALLSPIKVTAYKGVLGSTVKETYNKAQNIDPNQLVSFSFNIDNFKQRWGTDKVVINVNDGGDNSPAQAVCESSETKAERTPLLMTVTGTNPDCSTGKGTITITGAPTGVSFSKDGTTWQTGTNFTNLAAGTYTINAKSSTDTKNTSKASITITIPTAVTFDLAQTSETCLENDGVIKITNVSGGTGSHKYKVGTSAWKTLSGSLDLENYVAGTYSIEIRDSKECPLSKNITVASSGKSPSGSVQDAPKATIDRKGDLLITSKIKNVGSDKFTSPFKMTVYKNTLGNAKKEVGLYSNDINKGNTATINVKIKNFKKEWVCNEIVVNLNDAGTGSRDQNVCVVANREYKLKLVQTNEDTAYVFKCGTSEINVLANDNSTTTEKPTIVQQGKYGTAIVNTDGSIKYTHTGGTNPCSSKVSATDTVVYQLCESGNCSQSNVIVYALNVPKIILEDSCSFKPYLTSDIEHNAVSYKWEFMKEGTSTWATLTETSSKCDGNKAGKYKLTLTLSKNNSKTIVTTTDKKLVIIKEITSKGKTWYSTALK